MSTRAVQCTVFRTENVDYYYTHTNKAQLT